MANSKVLKAFLIISGLLLTFIGAATLFMPVQIKSASGVDVAGNVSVLNDIRASAALILSLALLILSGAFVKKLTYTSFHYCNACFPLSRHRSGYKYHG